MLKQHRLVTPTLYRMLAAAWCGALTLACSVTPAAASGFREAPAITRSPQVDGSDFYMFRSYEAGREGFVTIIANYNPLQDPSSGPNYFSLDEEAFYDIHIINDGDEDEDLTFRFRFFNKLRSLTLNVGDPGATESIKVPLANAGPTGSGLFNVIRNYSVRLIRGRIDQPTSITYLQNVDDGRHRLGIPYDNSGPKTIPDYERHANRFVYDVTIPGCGGLGRVFVGQRKESFQGDLGGLFDLANFADVLGPRTGRPSNTAGKNVTSLALEVPIDCLTEGKGDVIAGWTTSRLPRHQELKENPVTYEEPAIYSGDYVQVSRVGNPLVSEFLIGLPDKDLFNASHPRDDAQIVIYVTHPALPELMEQYLADRGIVAPNFFPRDDLVTGFMTGAPGLNATSTQGEVMRLNTALPPVPAAQQSNLGVLGGDPAGYPNGRRPGDDVLDNSLRVLMGATIDPPEAAPSGQLPYTDGVDVNAQMFDETFPYLTSPLPGTTHDP
ncbi:MAG TPA: DUF4331 domain-containing protein [Thermoanaerobaculia bacterium]|jgi:hypothetical protein